MAVLRIRDEAGNILVNMDSRLGQIIGTLDGVGEAGTYADSRLSMGSPFIVMTLRSSTGNIPSPSGMREGAWSYSGGVLSWSGWAVDPSEAPHYRRVLYYGYY